MRLRPEKETWNERPAVQPDLASSRNPDGLDDVVRPDKGLWKQQGTDSVSSGGGGEGWRCLPRGFSTWLGIFVHLCRPVTTQHPL